MMTPVVMELTLGYHPYSTGFLTCSRDPAGGQCLTGSLTGAVASEHRGLRYSNFAPFRPGQPTPGFRYPKVSL